jgi:hypothetical protein
MIRVLVPLLLKRNVGVLFGVLRGPRSDVPPFLQLYYAYCIYSHCIPVTPN